MNQKQLNILVKKEAKKLKENATEKELSNLDFSNLRPSSSSSCIYGQLSGDCFNTRTSDLIHSCAERIYSSTGDGLYKVKLNGKPEKKRTAYKHYSPIEVFIFQSRNRENGNNELLVKYLKGESKTLKIK